MTLRYKKELVGCLLVPLYLVVAVVAILTTATVLGTWCGIVWGAALQARNWFLH